jgi:steroid delta-isomerase-like uncharacterized protein
VPDSDAAAALIRRYYEAFNAGDRPGMLALLSKDVVHDVNQGEREIGREAFAAFLAQMDRCYREQVVELAVMVDVSGTRAAAEFTVLGVYVATDAPLPPAAGQRYRLPAGAFFVLREGRIARVTTYYNLQEWLRQVAPDWVAG